MLVLAIGISRLALGLHFVSDVLAGYVLGIAWLAASVAAFEIWRQDRGLRPTRPLEERVEPEESATSCPADRARAVANDRSASSTVIPRS
jgi:undecaprenyl-diphosphatase